MVCRGGRSKRGFGGGAVCMNRWKIGMMGFGAGWTRDTHRNFITANV